MKLTIKASIGGVPFNIEDKAYHFLEVYIESIRRHLSSFTDAQEVINDVEVRIAEILLGMLGKTEIVTLQMAQNVTQIIGKPQDFGDDADRGEFENTFSQSKEHTKRKLYRDPEKSIIAGVCSGLGLFLNANPLIFRIVLSALFLLNGLGLIIYAVLWIAVPRALTHRQRMEMRGEDFNLNNIEKQIKEEYESVRSNFRKFHFDLFIESLIRKAAITLKAIGQLIKVTVRLIIVALGTSFMAVGIFALLVFISTLLLHNTLFAEYFPGLQNVTIRDIVSSAIDVSNLAWLIVPLFISLAIPILLLIYLGIRMVFRFRSGAYIILSALLSLWALSIVTVAFVILFQARSFTISETVSEPVNLYGRGIYFNTLTINSYRTSDTVDYQDEIISINEQYAITSGNGNVRVIGSPRILFKKSLTDSFEVFIEKTARGSTSLIARANAAGVEMGSMAIDSVLSLSPNFVIPQGLKWRIQDVVVNIYIPEGKSVTIDPSVEELIYPKQPHTNLWPNELAGRTWVMMGNGLMEAK